jgi:hypothetical protein
MLEDGVVIHKSAGLQGFIYIENDVQIGEYSQVGMPSQPKGELSAEFTWVRAGARIGHHSQIAGGVTIGKGAWLEPFSQVDCDVPAGVQAGGSPLILKGYLCHRCGSLLSTPFRQLERCSTGSPPAASSLSRPAGQVICRVCGSSHIFTEQHWRWVGRELPSPGEPWQIDSQAAPSGLRRFMKW